MSIYLDLPRLNLGFFPTPLILLKNLTAHFNGPTIYMKRDDCTGLATGGNKARKLEFLMADAQKNNCNALVTGGGIKSNHARQTAAAKYGLDCYLVLNESYELNELRYGI